MKNINRTIGPKGLVVRKPRIQTAVGGRDKSAPRLGYGNVLNRN